MSEKIRITVDHTAVDESLDYVDQQVKIANQNMARALRRTAYIGLYVTQAVGIAVDEIFRVAIQTGTQIVEYATAAIAASSFTPYGLATSAVRIGAIIALMAQMAALSRGQTEAAQRLGEAEMAFTLLIW